MKKLTFRYSAMNAGKTRNFIGTYYNYRELGLIPIIVTPDIIKDNLVVSRDGQSIPSIPFSKIDEHLKSDVILVDEGHMLSKNEVLKLSEITIKYDIPIIVYGLRTDYKGDVFEGSMYLLGIADSLEELPTLCSCGKKARMNLRLIDGKVDKSNDSRLRLREEEDISYISMCRECYYKIMNDIKDIKDIKYYDNTSKIKK